MSTSIDSEQSFWTRDPSLSAAQRRAQQQQYAQILDEQKEQVTSRKAQHKIEYTQYYPTENSSGMQRAPSSLIEVEQEKKRQAAQLPADDKYCLPKGSPRIGRAQKQAYGKVLEEQAVIEHSRREQQKKEYPQFFDEPTSRSNIRDSKYCLPEGTPRGEKSQLQQDYARILAEQYSQEQTRKEQNKIEYPQFHSRASTSGTTQHPHSSLKDVEFEKKRQAAQLEKDKYCLPLGSPRSTRSEKQEYARFLNEQKSQELLRKEQSKIEYTQFYPKGASSGLQKPHTSLKDIEFEKARQAQLLQREEYCLPQGSPRLVRESRNVDSLQSAPDSLTGLIHVMSPRKQEYYERAQTSQADNTGLMLNSMGTYAEQRAKKKEMQLKYASDIASSASAPPMQNTRGYRH